MTDALQLLIRSPFFEPIPDRHLAALAEEAEEERHEAGDRIIAQHEPAEACHVLIEGAVEMSGTRFNPKNPLTIKVSKL